MPGDRKPQLYLQTPQAIDFAVFSAQLAAALDAAEIACLRLSTSALAPDAIRRLCEIASKAAAGRDVPLVIDNHWRLVQPMGLDGVHLTDGSKHVREARNLLGAEAIVGAYCGTSRHAGMTAAEMTADYIGFGPLAADPLLGDGSAAPQELFEWWAAMIEVPVVAEGAIALETLGQITPVADFICLGPEIWQHPEGPVAALRLYAGRLS